jgi:hypothetical protein
MSHVSQHQNEVQYWINLQKSAEKKVIGVFAP